jgi:hypothetical protein
MHRRRRLLAAFAAVALGSCGGDSTTESTLAVAPRTDLQIAELLYAGTPRTPDGFLADPVPSSYQQVPTFHNKSDQLDANAATSFEVCTDDFAEALAWSETLAQAASTYLDLVDSMQADRYFELDRVASSEPERLVRMRVYRCAYLDRSGVDLGSTAEAAGTLNARPVDAVALRELGEYLWRFTTYNNVDHAVLGSEANGTTTIEHVLTLASLARDAGAGGCDRVTLHEWLHTADAATGMLGHDDVALRTFDVRRDAGVVSGC